MNEIYRVLKNRGKFYAFTPYYPKAQVFQDPTHVNFITVDTHEYFVEKTVLEGFMGLMVTLKKLELRLQV